jgi:hypothetical protein
VYEWCRNKNLDPEQKAEDAAKEVITPIKRRPSFFRHNFSVSTQMFKLPSFLTEKEEKEVDEAAAREEATERPPKEWETADNMRPCPIIPISHSARK